MGGSYRQRVLVALACAACRFDAAGQPGSGDGESDSGTSAAQSSGETSDDAPGGPSGGASASGASVTAANDSTASTDGTTSGDGPDDTTVASTGPDPTTEGGADETGHDHAICGNGVVEDGEQCETNDLQGSSCSEKGGDFIGEPACSGCQVDLGPCCIQGGRGCVPWNDECCGTCYFFFCA